MAEVRRKQRDAERAAGEFFSRCDVQPYKHGGHHVYLRGTKLLLAKIFPGAVGLAGAMHALAEAFAVRKRPPKRYVMHGKRRGEVVGGKYITRAERRARAAQSMSPTAPGAPPRTPPVCAVHPSESIDEASLVSVQRADAPRVEVAGDAPPRPGSPRTKDG